MIFWITVIWLACSVTSYYLGCRQLSRWRGTEEYNSEDKQFAFKMSLGGPFNLIVLLMMILIKA